WRGKPVRSTPRRRRRPIGASRPSCCPFPGVGNGKHRPPPSPPLPPQGGENKQLSDPNSLFAASVSPRCARRDRPEAGRRPRYRKFESIPLQRRVACEPEDDVGIPVPRGNSPQIGGPAVSGNASLNDPGVVGAGSFPRSFLIPRTDTSIAAA